MFIGIINAMPPKQATKNQGKAASKETQQSEEEEFDLFQDYLRKKYHKESMKRNARKTTSLDTIKEESK
ncbi:MAG: hypothetical protein EOP45_13465 [Sphingobacteriaceae bacterium]|nr:MAG: hypothetical protein EOP45_13465 [Sphingobacteriaceae bacterium]